MKMHWRLLVMRCSRKLPCANCPSISYFVHNCEEKLHMPLGNKTRKAPLTKDNLTHLLDVIKPVKNGEQHLGLLLLIADMLDCIANGEEWYMVIGSCLLYTSPSPRDRQKSR